MFSSKQCRRRLIKRYTSKGSFDAIQAAQVAWAEFPFQDQTPPSRRSFEDAVRSRSWEQVRQGKRIGIDPMLHGFALAALRDFVELGGLHGESYYARLHGEILEGRIPTE